MSERKDGRCAQESRGVVVVRLRAKRHSTAPLSKGGRPLTPSLGRAWQCVTVHTADLPEALPVPVITQRSRDVRVCVRARVLLYCYRWCVCCNLLWFAAPGCVLWRRANHERNKKTHKDKCSHLLLQNSLLCTTNEDRDS